jgi:hypothetical protein
MKNIIDFIRKNKALSIVFGAEALALLYGFVWTVSFALAEKPATIAQKQVFLDRDQIVAEASLTNILDTYIDEIATSEAEKLVPIKGEEQLSAIDKFLGDQADMIVLTRELTSEEILKINPSRLPIEQESITITSEEGNTNIYLIKDNAITSEVTAGITNKIHSKNSGLNAAPKVKNS